MTKTIPPDWTEISVAQFELLLARCDDFRRASYIGCSVYEFTHSGQVFAQAEIQDKVEKVYVNPKLIEIR